LSYSAAERVVAEAELPDQRVGQRQEPVQRVVVVAGCAAIGRSQRLAIRGRVIRVRILEVLARQVRILRGRGDQAAHVVVGKAVNAGRVGHLANFSHEVIDVIDCCLIGVNLVGQPIERVVNVLDRLVLVVGLRGQIVELVVGVGFRECRGESGLGRASQRIIREICDVIVRIRDRCEVVLGVLGILRLVRLAPPPHHAKTARAGDPGAAPPKILKLRGA